MEKKISALFIYDNMKKNSIGKEKKVEAKFIKSKVIISISVLNVISTLLSSCTIGNNDKRSEQRKEINDLFEEYDTNILELDRYEKVRINNLLIDNNLNNYVDTEEGRHYTNSYTDYIKIEQLDDTYLYGFNLLADDESVDEMCKAFGYSNLDEYLLDKKYVDENGKIDTYTWFCEDAKTIVPLMGQVRGK